MLDCTPATLLATGSRPRASLVALLLVTGLGLLLAPSALAKEPRPTEIPYDQAGDFPSLDPSYRKVAHKLVLITDESLNPRLVTLDEGQLVAWISYSGWPSVVTSLTGTMVMPMPWV